MAGRERTQSFRQPKALAIQFNVSAHPETIVPVYVPLNTLLSGWKLAGRMGNGLKQHVFNHTSICVCSAQVNTSTSVCVCAYVSIDENGQAHTVVEVWHIHPGQPRRFCGDATLTMNECINQAKDHAYHETEHPRTSEPLNAVALPVQPRHPFKG